MKSSCYIQNSRITKFTSVRMIMVLFIWGAYFCMSAYKRDAVVVIKMWAYIYGVLILCGCLFLRFYSKVVLFDAIVAWMV